MFKIAKDARSCEQPVYLKNPVPISPEKLNSLFKASYRIPNPLPEELTYKRGRFSKKEITTVDLSVKVPRWLSMDFRSSKYGADQRWLQSVGNLLEEFSKYRNNPETQNHKLEIIKTRYPKIWEVVKGFLPEWARDDFLFSPQWDPYKIGLPEEAQNDGILERPAFLLKSSLRSKNPYNLKKDIKIYQACAPIYAPLKTIFTVENGFKDYPQQIGSNYKEVYPIKGTYFCGLDQNGHPFIIYDVSYKQKPIKLFTLNFILRQFLHYREGRWLMENKFLEGDMNRLRLKIFYDPIITTYGRIIGYIKTEWMDIDIKGLPEGDSDRKAAVRGDVGNIKRMAENMVYMEKQLSYSF